MMTFKCFMGSLYFCVTIMCTVGAADVKPEDFVDANGNIDEQSLVEYLLWKKDLYYTHRKSSPAQKKEAVAVWLTDLEDHIGAPPPYTVEQVKKAQAPTKDAVRRDVARGLIREPLTLKNGTAVGPVRIRKTVEDWDKDLDDVSGASLGYQDNRLSSSHAWSAEGAVSYPFRRHNDLFRKPDSAFKSTDLTVLPTVSFKVNDLSDTAEGEVEDLVLGIPVSFGGNRKFSAGQWREEWMFHPFFQTDFHGDGEIVGANLEYEPLFQIGAFDVGQWHSFFGSPIAYLLRVRPKLEFSEVIDTSRFIDREEGDTWFRAGATLHLGIRPFGSSSPWELRTEYRFGHDLTDDDDSYSDLFEAKTTYWINENIGLSLRYQDGETPVSDKEIELLSLQLEIKM